MTDDPKTRKRTHAALNMDLFNSMLLRDEVSLEIAIGALEAHLGDKAADIGLLLDELYTTQHLLEFSLSAICDETFVSVKQRIMEKFPTQPQNFASSLACKLIDRFSLYHYFLSYTPSEEPPDLRERHRSAQLSVRALEALLASSFLEEEAGVSGSKVSKRKKSNARPSSDSVSLQSKPFHDLRVDVPRSRQDATRLVERLLLNLKDILHYYLVVFRYPSLRDLFRNTYIPEKLSTDVVAPESDLPQPAEVLPVAGSPAETPVDQTPAVFREMPYMQMALDTDNARGLGEWHILISKRAAGDLRQTFNRDPKLFKIIMRKIRELSNGPSNWSQDNHRHLNLKHETDVPIYAAALTGDSRLIYQVDCVRDFQANCDTQALKIFAIVTHAQMGEHLWESVGHSLSGNGSEYRKRCVYRNRPVGGVIHPASFPLLPAPESESRSSSLPTLHKEDLGKLHELLVLDKYYPFSQALINSIVANRELSLVFQVSEEENRIMEYQSSCYVMGRSGTGKTTTMLFKMLQIELHRHLLDLQNTRQLFVTKSQVLVEKVEEHFVQLQEAHRAAYLSREELAIAAANRTGHLQRGLYDADEMINWGGHLPKRWSELRIEHFPLIISYDHLAQLLENDINDSLDASQRKAFRGRRSFVSFDAFRTSYWPQFPQPLTKGLDATLVFGEFMGVIKGSEAALASPERHLDEDNYHKLKGRRSHALAAGQVNAIYQLYEIYSKMKRERGQYDAADRTHRILDYLRDRGIPGDQIDFLYVDEVQDNLLVDLLVLRSLCGNSSGLFWAGDTAQTISIGSAFKFNELKAFMHRVEATVNPSSTHQVEPKFFQSCVNYRSHAGIVNCAHSVIDLLTMFWPNSIDSVAQEKELIDGPKPLFFSGGEADSVRYEQFLFGDSGGTLVEFGAKQCILVRDDAARDRLRERFGDVGTIFTLYESKGQEFDDVLLYNFFEDSVVDAAKWRVVLNALPKRRWLPAPPFDDVRHSAICHELKCLYVAITRARKILWIADNPEKFDPMLTFWTARDQIEVWEEGTELPRLATSSTPEEWAHVARTHFEGKYYAHAMRAFERALLPRETAVAEAFYLREKARDTPIANATRSLAFNKAAKAFQACANSEQATANEQRMYFHNSAQCFSESGKWRRAAECYIQAEDYAEAALCHAEAVSFDEAVEIIKRHTVHVDQAAIDVVYSSAIPHYFKNSQPEKAISLFTSSEDALAYMERQDLNDERAQYLEKLGMLEDAADLLLSEGHTFDAMGLFLQCQDIRPIRQAEKCLLGELWRHLSFGVRPDHGKEIIRKLADLVTRFAIPSVRSRTSLDGQDQIDMFSAILIGDRGRLKLLHPRFLEKKNIAARLLCLDHIFVDMLSTQITEQGHALCILQDFRSYLDLMTTVAKDANSGINPALRQLFGVQGSTTGGFTLPCGIWLYRMAAQSSGSHTIKNIRVSELTALIRRSLECYLRQRITQGDGVFKRTRIFAPCLSFAIFGHCDEHSTMAASPSCHRDHQTIDSLGSSSYHARIRIILSRIGIFQKSRWAFVDTSAGSSMLEERMFLEELYHAIVPSFLICESVPVLTTSLIPELTETRPIIRGWIDSLFLQRYDTTPWLTVAEVMTLRFFLERTEVQGRLRSLPSFHHCNVEQLLRGWNHDDCYIVEDLMVALQSAGPSVTSFGVLYALHIIYHELPVDLEALCSLLEYLCGSFVLMHRELRGFPAHDVILPRSWLLGFAHWEKIEGMVCDDYGFLTIFLRPMSILLEALYSRKDTGHFSLEGSKLGDERQSNGTIARICRMLGLLGFNLQDDEVKRDIFAILTSLRQADRQFDLRCGSFINARRWKDIVDALQFAPVLDPLIRVRNKNVQNNMVPRLTGVPRLLFDSSEDIVTLVAATPAARNPTKAATAVTAVPDANPDTVVPLAITAHGDSTVQDLSVGDDDAIDDLTDTTSVIDFDAWPVEEAAHVSEEMVTAASRIALAYRQFAIRRQEVAERDITRFFLPCLSEYQFVSEHHEAMRGVYRLYFLGPLPHVLLSLDGILAYAEASKKKAKKQRTTAVGQELQRWDDQLTRDTSLVKDAKRLQKVLHHCSEFHRKGDLGKLKAHVVEVAQLEKKYDIPKNVGMKWEEDLRLAMKAFATT